MKEVFTQIYLIQDLLYKEYLYEESYFGCSGATCGTQCSYMFVVQHLTLVSRS